MHKPSEIRIWDALRTQQYCEEKNFKDGDTSVIEPPTIALLRKQKEAEISTNVVMKHAFGLMMMIMIMSWLKTLNKMSAAIITLYIATSCYSGGQSTSLNITTV